MDNPQSPPLRGSLDSTWSGTLVAIALVPLGLMLRDLHRVTTTAPWSLSTLDAAIFVAIGTALGMLVLGAMLLPRLALGRLLSAHGRSGQSLIGALDGAVLAALFVLMQDPTFLVGDLRVCVSVGAIAVFALLRFGWSALTPSTSEKVAHAVAIASVLGGSGLLSFLRWNGDWWLKLIPQAMLAVAIGHFATVGRWSLGRPTRLSMAGVVLLLVIGSGVVLRASPPAHNALLHGTTHARVWTQLFQRASDIDRDGATSWLGGVDCDGRRSAVHPGASERPGNGVDDDCQGGDGQPSAAPPHSLQRHGAAAGSDVLLLSVDSLRSDAIDDLSELWNELGPHARFERALSPAPGTKESLSATIRGRSVRQLRWEEAPSARGLILWRDPSLTLGHVLLKAGYRTVTVPTSNVAEPRLGIASGFDHIWVANYDGRAQPATRSPLTQRYVPAEQALPIALNAARETPHKLCVWVHLMEPHYPFHIEGAADAGPTHGRPRFQRSVRETAHRLTLFVREWKRVRGRAPIVAVFGDHGEELGEHGGQHHASTVYAEQVRVTLVLAGPGVPSGAYAAPVSNASLPATILDLLGLEAPRSMIAPSLLPLMLNEAAWPALAVSELHLGSERVYGYTGARYRYIWDPFHHLEQLFDSRADPTEQHDIASTQPAALAEMRRLARAWDETH